MRTVVLTSEAFQKWLAAREVEEAARLDRIAKAKVEMAARKKEKLKQERAEKKAQKAAADATLKAANAAIAKEKATLKVAREMSTWLVVLPITPTILRSSFEYHSASGMTFSRRRSKEPLSMVEGSKQWTGQSRSARHPRGGW